MKKIIAIMCVILLSRLLAGCGNSQSVIPPEVADISWRRESDWAIFEFSEDGQTNVRGVDFRGEFKSSSQHHSEFHETTRFVVNDDILTISSGIDGEQNQIYRRISRISSDTDLIGRWRGREVSLLFFDDLTGVIDVGAEIYFSWEIMNNRLALAFGNPRDQSAPFIVSTVDYIVSGTQLRMLDEFVIEVMVERIYYSGELWTPRVEIIAISTDVFEKVGR